ncbi:Nucleotide-diphospho-sugar transferases [Moorella glycerini]|uniref:UTP--glucose-1-phosphate uridylyltransferase n=1 Tax=Neomoorella stamsii TaxID=1266720 RepID=A0A9X7P648_9FIRM|nr:MULTISPECIES: UTP--glucose-1-phosphate uridylyltransferase GalU [Moorella]PRR72720.1 UTP--glucose-1-phosphate uridylyltransferase [Moorella stamsii]CEP68065.1 Nucleotide-diphospho-sugar transferases [Moorella glycerini]
MLTVKKAIIPAAGWGTRFLPATKAQPKEMLPIVDKPAIQFIVEEAVNAGVEDILIITGKNKRAIEDHFDRSLELESLLREKDKEDLLALVEGVAELADIHYIRQKEQLGLGHAVYCARKFIGQEPFAVLLGDDIIVNTPSCLEQMLEVYNEVKAAVIAVQEVPREEVNRYGVIEPLEINGRLIEVKDLVEKPRPEEAPSNLAVIGRYILVPEIFPLLAEVKPGAGGEIQLTDALRLLAREERVYAYRFQGKRYDIGDKLGFLQATVEFALARPDLAGPFREYLAGIISSAPGNLDVAAGEVS